MDVTALLHCAVYALVKKGTVVYVGQSRTPFKRIYTHASARGRPLSQTAPYMSRTRGKKLGFQFDAVWIRPCGLAEVDDLEREMIEKYQPRHNDHFTARIPEELKTLVASIVRSGVCAPPPAPTLNIRRRV